MKFCLYIALCVSLIYFALVTTHNPNLEDLGAGEYCIYSTETVTHPSINRVVNSGLGFIYYVDSGNAAEVRKLFNPENIDGESLTLNKQLSSREVLKTLGYKQLSQTNDGVMISTYGYSTRGADYIEIEGQKINIQVVNRGNTTVIGWPVILGSY